MFGIRRVDRKRGIQLTCSQLLNGRLCACDKVHVESSDVRRAAKIGGVCMEFEDVAALPTVESIWTRSDRCVIECGGGEQGRCREHMRGQNRIVLGLEKIGEKRRERHAQVYAHGEWIGCLDRANAVETEPRRYGIAWVHHGAVRGDYIRGGKARTVVPPHTRAQAVHDRHSIGGDIAVRNRRNAQREIGDEPAAIVDAQQLRIQ